MTLENFVKEPRPVKHRYVTGGRGFEKCEKCLGLVE